MRSLLTIGCTLLVAEVAVRLTGILSTYSERNFGIYRSVLGSTKPTWFLTRPPSTSFVYETADFAVPMEINRDGVRDVEHALEPSPGLPRIVVLGDSYTEGVGVPFEQSWPQILGRRLREAGRPVEILQAGVSGSDPFFEYRLLEQCLVRYAPRLVLFLINDTDICDTLWWGGLERFHADGTTHARPAPWFEPLYRRSHLVRLAVHTRYDWRMMPYSRTQRLDGEAQGKLVRLFTGARSLGKESGFDLWVGVHPTPDDVLGRKRPFSPAFFRALDESGVPHGDLGPGMEQAFAGLARGDFSWEIDRHYNARGYAVMAELVLGALEESGVLERLVAGTPPSGTGRVVPPDPGG
ncbi:MAG: GDSL-type esterase/lipase family protein [Thermoanaerobaculia bacterium]